MKYQFSTMPQAYTEQRSQDIFVYDNKGVVFVGYVVYSTQTIVLYHGKGVMLVRSAVSKNWTWAYADEDHA